MKYLAMLVCLVVLSSCNKNGGLDLCNSNQAQGSDGACYSCSVGTPETAGSTFGYCSQFNSAGVACCSSSYYSGWGSGYGSITCPNASYPYLCTDGQCWNRSNGNGYLSCVYDH